MACGVSTEMIDSTNQTIVNRKEERRRAEYIKQSDIMTGANDIYLTALLESFTGPQEGEAIYRPNVAAFEFMHGDGA